MIYKQGDRVLIHAVVSSRGRHLCKPPLEASILTTSGNNYMVELTAHSLKRWKDAYMEHGCRRDGRLSIREQNMEPSYDKTIRELLCRT